MIPRPKIQKGYSLLRHNPLPQPNIAVITPNRILTTVPSHCCGSKLQSLDDWRRLSHYLKWRWLYILCLQCLALLPNGTNINKTMSVFIHLYNFNAGGGGQKQGTEMFCSSTNSYVMMQMHKMVANIQTKHDALTNFFSSSNYGAISVKCNVPLNQGVRRI